MTIRSQVEASFSQRSTMTWVVYLGVPVFCLAIPGPGVLLAAIWVLLFLWLGRQKVAAVGLRAPRQWMALVALAFGIAIIVWLIDGYLLTPLAESLTGTEKNLDMINDLKHNWSMFLFWLALGWVVGGVLEELVFRGFLINVGMQVFGKQMVWPLAVFSAVLFGLSHLYQGPVGVLTTGIIALLLSVTFVMSRNNLLLTILVHGFVNTISLTLAFLGLTDLL